MIALNERQQREVENEFETIMKIASTEARRYRGIITKDEAESAACLGAMQSASKFDPQKGILFRTFMAKRVRLAVTDHVRASTPGGTKSRKGWEKERLVDFHGIASSRDKDGPKMPIGLEPVTNARPESRMMNESSFMDLVNEITVNKIEEVVVRCIYQMGKTMRETGDYVGLSESRISQIHSVIIRRARKIFAKKNSSGA